MSHEAHVVALYGIGVLLVALIGLIEAVLSAGALRTTLESAAVPLAVAPLQTPSSPKLASQQISRVPRRRQA